MLQSCEADSTKHAGVFLLMKGKMIIYPESYTSEDVKRVFKWMWNPKTNTILICRDRDYHAMIFREYKLKGFDSGLFEEWVRFIHLEKEDFKNSNFKDATYVRVFPKTLINKGSIKKMLLSFGITKMVFDITNEKLHDITENYLAKY